MIMDGNLIVSGTVGGTATSPSLTGQAVTATAVSTNTIDLAQARDLFEGNDMVKARFFLTAAFATNTSLTFEIIVASDAALSTNVKVVGSSGAIPVASLTAGATFFVEGNAQIGSLNQRYLGVRYTIGGSNATTGAVLADFGDAVQDGKKFYPVGFAVL